MNITKFETLADLVFIELFSYFSCCELLNSFLHGNNRLDNILFQSGIIRHINWIELSNYHRNLINDRLFLLNSLTTNCLNIATLFLQRKNLHKLTLIDILPGDLMDYIWTDWQHALDGLKQLHFIVINCPTLELSQRKRDSVFLSYLIGYVPTIRTVDIPSYYKFEYFGSPPITIGSIKYLSVTVKGVKILLDILHCLRSCIRQINIRFEFLLNLFGISSILDTQNSYNNSPLQKLYKVTLHNISFEIDDERIIPWINEFLNKDYMPSLQIFHFIKNKNSQTTINQQLFRRSDIQINII